MKLEKSMIERYPVLTDGKTIVAYTSDVFEKLGIETIYHIGNQLRHYYSNNKKAILDMVGKCGKTETRPTELKLVKDTLHFPAHFPAHHRFIKYLD